MNQGVCISDPSFVGKALEVWVLWIGAREDHPKPQAAKR